jgi:hypothetical protein
MNVAQMAGLPADLIRKSILMSTQFEKDIQQKRHMSILEGVLNRINRT